MLCHSALPNLATGARRGLHNEYQDRRPIVSGSTTYRVWPPPGAQYVKEVADTLLAGMQPTCL
jgi:hypothetical protein